MHKYYNVGLTMNEQFFINICDDIIWKYHIILGVFSRWYPIGQRILHPEIAGVKSLFPQSDDRKKKTTI